MKVTIETPSKAYLSDFTLDEITALMTELTYTNTAITHDIKRLSNNQYFRRKNEAAWRAAIDDLKARQKRTLVYEETVNGERRTFIRPGSIHWIKSVQLEVENIVKYPMPKPMPWAKVLPFELHEYQVLSWRNLLLNKHANVELCTSAGKSAILLKLTREMGMRTVIVVPSRSIFQEQVHNFEKHLGKGNVGAFGDGKKKLGKKITIAIGDSLANVKPGSPEWDFFQTVEMMAVDESHQWGAESLEAVCFGVMGMIPYRFFLSGTQTRGDGGEKLLQSIIGPTVHSLPTWKAVHGGFICPHEYVIIDVESSNPNFYSKDALEMKRAHFLNNKNIAAIAAKIANATATQLGHQTLILVEELPQIAAVAKLLSVPFAYAHSETKKDRLAELGLEKVDPMESVEKFNSGEAMVLIGTSCIATGTNIYPTHSTINWVGGASEIKTKQGAVGRSVRHGQYNKHHAKLKPKPKAVIYDFDLVDVDSLGRHLDTRIEYYMDSFAPGEEPKIKRIKLNKKSHT
jgi:superfamily II DNA or RNA helicase